MKLGWQRRNWNPPQWLTVRRLQLIRCVLKSLKSLWTQHKTSATITLEQLPRLSSFSVGRLRQSHVPSWRISKHEKGYVTWWKRDENVWWSTKTPALVAKYSVRDRCLRKVIWTRNFVRSIHIFNRNGKVVERWLSGCGYVLCACYTPPTFERIWFGKNFLTASKRKRLRGRILLFP